MLGLQDLDRQEDITRLLSQANTEDAIRQIIIMDLLFEAMRENSDRFPNQLRISQVEEFRGEAFH